MKSTSLFDRIVVKRLSGRSGIVDGLLLSTNKKKKNRGALVISIGIEDEGGVDKLPLTVRVNGQTYFCKYAQAEVKVDCGNDNVELQNCVYAVFEKDGGNTYDC